MDNWSVKFVPLPRPQLLVTQTSDAPELPSLPSAELVLPASSQRFKGYCGEELHGLVVATCKDTAVEEFPLQVHLSAQVLFGGEPPKSFNFSAQSVTRDRPYAVSSLSFPLSWAGKWQVRASLQIDRELESDRLAHVMDLDVAMAVRILFKVSRGAAELNAHVLEAQVENCSDSVLCIESCELKPLNSWEVEQVGSASAVLVRPHEIFQYCFLLRGGTSSEAAVLVVGWRREPVGSKGWQTTKAVRI